MVARQSSSFPAMFFICYKHLVFSFLLINFTFSNQLVEAQTLIHPNFDQALLPFGSPANSGGFNRRCIRNGREVTFTVLNNCSHTVWAAATPGGGRQLYSGQFWTLNVPANTQGRIWGRTNCAFDDGSNPGKCETGDCSGVLQCQSFGAPPNTIAEFALDRFNSLDFFDISLVNGFNIPIEFNPTSDGCSQSISCTADIKGECPTELTAAGGCNDPCTVFGTSEYCCTNGTKCGPTNYSKFFKDRCPDAYSYPQDSQTNAFTCPAGTNYGVVFCPSSSSIGG